MDSLTTAEDSTLQQHETKPEAQSEEDHEDEDNPPAKPDEKYLKQIIAHNLSVGHFNETDHFLKDDDVEFVDMKSNASNNWRRGSVSYSQPNSPVSSISELSTENPDDGDSESCASLNSVHSTQSNDSFGAMLHELIAKEVIIHEHQEQDDADTHATDGDIDHENEHEHNNDEKASSHRFNKYHRRSHHHRNSKHKLLPPSSSHSNKQHKQKKDNVSMTRSASSSSSSKHARTNSEQSPKSRRLHRRRNSKDCLDITAISRLATKPIETWTVSEVVEWVKLIAGGKYKEHAEKFEAKRIDGRKLYKLNRTMLQSMDICHPSARKAILAALQKLKTKVRQTAKKKVDLYAKQHDYGTKKKRRHQRGVTSPSAPNLHDLSSETYVVAVRKQSSNDSTNHHTLSVHTLMPLLPSLSAPDPQRKASQDISEFLHEWEIQDAQDGDINFINSSILQQTDNFTMIQLETKRIVYAVTAKVEKWSNDDVCKWLDSVANGRYKGFICKFQERNTNGFDLLNLSRVQLQNNIGMMDPEMRSSLLHEIKLLKLATQPNRKSYKKRSSAVSIQDLSTASLRKSRSATGHHRKTRSMGVAFSDLCAPKHSKSAGQLDYVPPRKLGPRDIGRIRGYKGTKYEKKMFEYDFLEEKINYKVTATHFEKRKQANPVQHKLTVDEIGVATDYERPEFMHAVLLDMKRSAWLPQKPISRRNAELDKLKGHKIERNCNVSDIQSPVGWEPIKFKFEADGKSLFAEHLWFDGSGVQFEFALISRCINCLPPQKQLQLKKQDTPTGYESKLNYLKMLTRLIQEEMDMIKKEDALYADQPDVIVIQSDNDEENEAAVPVLGQPPQKIEVIHEEKEHETDTATATATQSNDNEEENENVPVKESEEVKENECEPPEVVLEVDQFRRKSKKEEIMAALNAAAPSSSEAETSESDSDSNSMSRRLASPSSATKKMLYKAARGRDRANTTLANSTLPRVGSGRTFTRQDMNRRRFLSQESLDSIQAMISNIEKQRDTQ